MVLVFTMSAVNETRLAGEYPVPAEMTVFEKLAHDTGLPVSWKWVALKIVGEPFPVMYVSNIYDCTI